MMMHPIKRQTAANSKGSSRGCRMRKQDDKPHDRDPITAALSHWKRKKAMLVAGNVTV